ncbi:GEVED domain-containing protein [Paraflavitalea sp. CAU 1676]|uniref:GEVED domain-containing protein n=1 Tax=Paraflavitalea sp. CAU 1676 TaxID=3032598 RepID=UPI0023DA5D34|nr:GEVED domain-containing protein [Paraflavitalea sp. CAU 1676]MDF2190656.1 GEVED domain-containing protein [Paraflavitalea sp. CAU 1676]
MKLLLPFVLLITLALCATQHILAQTNYSFSINAILNSMPNGLRLPNGTIVKVDKITTGTGVHSATSGQPGPQMGGTFTGNTLPQYVGDHTPTQFSVIETTSSATIDGGVNNNCQNSIGYRIYFDRPTIKISFLSVDIDGTNTNPGNAEWVSSFAYNGTTLVPYDQINSSSGIDAVGATTINTSAAGHNWRTLITSTLGAAATANFPNSYIIQRAAGGGFPPDDVRGQALFTPTDPNAAITSFFLMWGLWQVPAAPTTQTSGLSPIVVRVSPDFGDLPDSYATLLASGGASHGVVGSLTLGTNENTKPDGTPSALANTDPDDDGIAVVPIIPNNSNLSQTIPTYSLTTTFNNTTGQAANFAAWIDWNNNGNFDAGEGQTASSPGGTTSGTITFTWNNVTLSGIAGTTHTYARIRTSTEAITTAQFTGALKDGEVEDYLVPFTVTLPLHLISFTGKLEGTRAHLTWITQQEENMEGFEVERSYNGIDYIKAGFIGATNAGHHQYNFVDNYPLQPTGYYRLKMLDKDGRFQYSTVVILKPGRGQQSSLQLSPNPVSNVLNISIPVAESFTFHILDIKGQVLRTLSSNGSNALSIDVTGLSQGQYYLKATNRQGKTQTLRFMKNQ